MLWRGAFLGIAPFLLNEILFVFFWKRSVIVVWRSYSLCIYFIINTECFYCLMAYKGAFDINGCWSVKSVIKRSIAVHLVDFVSVRMYVWRGGKDAGL